MHWEIIEATKQEDYLAAIELFKEYVASLDFDLSFQNFDEELTMMPMMYGSQNGKLFLVQSGGNYVGCAGLRRIENNTTCELKRMYIKPAYRQLGVGKAIMRLAIDNARAMGYKVMKLDTIGYKMPLAVKLYKSFGFKETTAYNYNPHDGVVYFKLKL